MKKIAIGAVFVFLFTFLMQASLWTQKDERLFREAKVLIFDEGNGAAQILKRSRSVIRTVIVGVVDEVDQT